MRLIAWLKKNPFTALLLAAGIWIAWRMWHGQAVLGAGHASITAAQLAGWQVYPAGVTGWEEHGPNGEVVMHDTGWDGTPV
ncbi:MAG TPA: hypothetical protein VJ801_07325 [Polyangia bacterium]|jgi:hypothetical protein|nr:hypothetical protein [Polyangia bacterium]